MAGMVITLAAAHFVHDVFTAFLAPVLPLIIEKLDLSLVLAGSLAVLLQLPSLLNPWIGSFADRGGYHRAMVVAGPAGTGIFMCLIGVAPTYAALAVLLLAAGLCVAVMHVAGPVMVSQFAGGSVGRGMSYFMVGGELARTVGPLIAVQIVSVVGLEGMWKVIPVAVASSVILWWRLRGVSVDRPETRPTGLFSVWRRMRRIMIAVTGILMARAFMVAGLGTFLPTLLYGEGRSLWFANIALSVFELAGAVGAFTSGTLSDRLGRRRVLLAAVALTPPLMIVFLLIDGPASLAVLAAVGFVALATSPVMMAVMIENAGADRAAANGTYFMVAFAARSLVLLVVGAMGDAIGLRATFLVCAGIAALGVPFVYLIPRERVA
jgi:FSR family fosmidomycin resistance protein-like MFS transporter